MQVKVIQKPELVYDKDRQHYEAVLRVEIDGLEYGQRQVISLDEVMRYHNVLYVLPHLKDQLVRELVNSVYGNLHSQIEAQLNE